MAGLLYQGFCVWSANEVDEAMGFQRATPRKYQRTSNQQ